ncbi:Ultraviolet-B receptor UVR8 [Diplonema papillatum]|nr:Ultraviolet-B receptor UVR8 [Diplonema papillatum]
MGGCCSEDAQPPDRLGAHPQPLPRNAEGQVADPASGNRFAAGPRPVGANNMAGWQSMYSTNSQVRTTSSAADFEDFPGSRPTATYVKSFGCNDQGQLGLTVHHASTPTVIQSISSTSFVNVVCGSWHTILLDAHNNIHVFGEGRDGQLGLGPLTVQVAPVINPFFRRKVARHIGCGERFTVIACEDGAYAFGTGDDGQLGLGGATAVAMPERIPFFEQPRDIGFIACGTHHVAVFYRGNIYTYGWNGAGQLMLGDTENRTTPTLVPFFANRNVRSAACGVQHTVVLCLDAVYVCGGNTYGQLGLGHRTHPQIRPVAMPFQDVASIRGVSAWYHTVFCTEFGVYTCGEAAFGKLGTGDEADSLTPQPVPGFSNKHALRAVAGSEHTAVFCVDGMYTFGKPSRKLGHGSHVPDRPPAESRILTLLDQRIIDFDVGIDHSVVIVEAVI